MTVEVAKTGEYVVSGPSDADKVIVAKTGEYVVSGPNENQRVIVGKTGQYVVSGPAETQRVIVGKTGQYVVVGKEHEGPYNEAATLGVTTGTTAYNATLNEKNVIPITVPAGGVWAKKLQLAFALAEAYDHRAIVYDGTTLAAASALRKAGVNTTGTTTVAGQVVDLFFNADQSPVFFPAGDYWIGAHSGNGADFMSVGSGAATSYTGGDAYSDGTTATFGAAPSTFGSYIRCSMPYSLTNGDALPAGGTPPAAAGRRRRAVIC